jgi:uridine phosphorylase
MMNNEKITSSEPLGIIKVFADENMTKVESLSGKTSTLTSTSSSKSSKFDAPHLKLNKGDISPLVIVVGDPFRVDVVGALCDNSSVIQWNREYKTSNASYMNKAITICSHGVGGPGAAICFEELIKLGAQVIIRLGTCGSLQPDKITQGDVVISTAAVREDGVTQYMVPAGFPAVADLELSLLLKSNLTCACQQHRVTYKQKSVAALPVGGSGGEDTVTTAATSISTEDGKPNRLNGTITPTSEVLSTAKAPTNDHCVFTGITLTRALFYDDNTSDLERHSKLGCVSVDMEISTLFTIASLRGIKAAACAVVDGSPLRWNEGDYDPHGLGVTRGKDIMFAAGLKTLVTFN